VVSGEILLLEDGKSVEFTEDGVPAPTGPAGACWWIGFAERSKENCGARPETLAEEGG